MNLNYAFWFILTLQNKHKINLNPLGLPAIKFYLAGSGPSIQNVYKRFKSKMVKSKMTLNELQHEAHKIAKEKGWYDNGPRPHLEIHALIHSEIAEATEEIRAGHDTIYFDGDKPLGVQIELADAILRIADHFQANGWDLETTVNLKMQYNRTRPHRHGKKLF